MTQHQEDKQSNYKNGQRQIPYDLTCKWNLNKQNKQAKKNQKHWNKEQTDSNQRGEGQQRKEGEESSRNMYKGPMYKDNRDGGLNVGEVGVVRSGGSNRGKMGTTVTEQQF